MCRASSTAVTNSLMALESASGVPSVLTSACTELPKAESRQSINARARRDGLRVVARSRVMATV
ncbi:MAG: hypothetical protein EB048_11415 [Gammaproteobacteria bacterium]|nr:hypothetical protein [Gammaproteobacteria bacterium]